MGKIMIITFLFLVFMNICSCSSEDLPFADEADESETGVEVIVGNDPNNTVFWLNAICEDEDYVYVSSHVKQSGFTNKNQNIIRIAKSDGSVTDLNLRGYNLGIYKGYLYFLGDNGYYFYRLNLTEPDAPPKCIALNSMYSYTILNDRIYPSGNPNGILSMNVDGSDKEETRRGDGKRYYVVYGYDDRYIYTVYPFEYEMEKIDGREICVQYLYRMGYDHENEEKLLRLENEVPNCFSQINQVMIISGGYAYYMAQYSDRHELARNKLTLNSEKEIIYRSSENEAIYLTAITNDGIYMQKFDIGDQRAYSSLRHPNTKLSLDGKTESPIDLDKKGLLFFVSRFDGKLYYVEDDKIVPLG